MSTDTKTIAAAIGAELRKHRSALMQEDRLQETIAAALTSAGLAFEREVRITPAERLDFLLTDSGIALEVKKDNASLAVWRQIGRYLEHETVRGCIVIAPMVERLPTATLAGKPIGAIDLWKFLF